MTKMLTNMLAKGGAAFEAAFSYEGDELNGC